MSGATIFFAVGRCQHGGGGCQEAAMFGQRSTIVSPDFPSLEALDVWLTHKASRPEQRRCRACKRPIAIKNFERRTLQETDEFSERVPA